MKALTGTLGGWTYDTRFDADGPTGTAQGYTKDSAVLLISIKWEPDADAGCPADQPIVNCPLTANQKLYTVVIRAAQR
jgi:hypothetical protein